MDHNLDQNTKDRLLAALGKVNLQDDDDTDRMVVALDFGTTYSGYDLTLPPLSRPPN